jgi:HlyD family secretion protein
MINNSLRLGVAGSLTALLFGVLGCARVRAEPTEELYQGTAELEERRLAFEVGGTITWLGAREGDEVAAGTLVATIDGALDEQARKARDLEARAAYAQSTVVDKGVRPEEIAVTRARLRAAQSSEALVKKQLERERDLLSRGVVPEARVDELEAQLARSVAEREALESQLSEQQRGARPEERAAARARADAVQAGVALDDLRIQRRNLHAPVAGVVLDVHVKAGEFVAPGAPVLTLAEPGRSYAHVFVPQAQLPGIDVGDRARVRADGLAAALGGHVEHIGRRTEFTPRYLFSEQERANLVVRVKVRIDDPKALLHAGVPVRVSIQRETPPSERVSVPPPTPPPGEVPRGAASTPAASAATSPSAAPAASSKAGTGKPRRP